VSAPEYDSRADTTAHVFEVGCLLAKVRHDLARRACVHDDSKFNSPEKEVFDRVTPRLKALPYMSDEYKASLADMGEALTHHYAANDHHPEHFGYMECNGCFKRYPRDYAQPCDVCGYTHFQFRPSLDGMSLTQIVEMLCDWLAACKRHDDGDIRVSIEKNQKRFGYSDELKQIFLNTLPLLEKE
jgi:hypothetical protein